jgi:phosphatidylserine decarboxylase
VRRFSFFASVGISWILSASILVVVLWVQFDFYVSLPAILLTLFLMRVYYDPDRELPSHPLGVMSPVDGVIESVDLMHDPFLDRPSQRIRIRSKLLGVYHVRSPTEGKISQFWPKLEKDKQEYTRETTRGVWWIKTDENDDVIIVLINKFKLGKLTCFIHPGERVGQARRCGHFPAGGMIDILIDENSFIEATEGQSVIAGVHRIATFNHEAISG